MAVAPTTIFALASAPGRAGVAVLRLSGPQAGAALLALTPDLVALPSPRRAVRVFLYAPEQQTDTKREQIDDGLALWFPAPASFSGEDVVELHVHGGHAVLDALMTSLQALPGLRPAMPGEFSRRAFECGKMDLTAVEAIADLVDAETAAQRQQALAQMGGSLSRLYDGWRARLISSLAFAEASIDFAEEDIPDDLARQSIEALRTLSTEIAAHLADGGIGERIRSGFRIALTGAPNVGKSSLLNALAKRDVAIVTDIAGTTRDVIEVPLDLGGYATVLIDTAGIRDSTDVIEQEGVRRARAEAATADLQLHLVEASRCPVDLSVDPQALLILTKSDQVSDHDRISLPDKAMVISALTGDGLGALIREITARIAARASAHTAASAPLTRARHRHALEECLAALERVLEAAAKGADEEMMAEDIRLAAHALGRITGRVDVEELLDRIFRDFCIGK
ncbi:MAG: tRNA uridine-5-carboxymethylaminomethyl(34) synthesis GTPase MnmE [Rhodospirillales bacterium]